MKLIIALIFVIPCALGNLWSSNDPCYLSPNERINQVDVHFHLCTRATRGGGRIGYGINNYTLGMYGFDPRFTTYILIHGFLRSHETFWVQQIKDILLKKGNANIILVDWSSAYMIYGGSLTLPTFDILNYKKAVLSSPNVADQIATLLQWTAHVSGTPLKRWYGFHFIGHSLGAHIAGQAARNLKKKVLVQRVTGLDPAGPCFEGIDTERKLTSLVAEFVDIIHSNCDPSRRNNFGIAEPIGTIDFYPNGGNHQPRCSPFLFGLIGNVLDWTGIKWLVAFKTSFLQKVLYNDHADFKDLISNLVKRSSSITCDHEESARYFVESMKFTSKKLYGVQFEQTREGIVVTSCAQMGMNANLYRNAQGVHFVSTNERTKPCTIE